MTIEQMHNIIDFEMQNGNDVTVCFGFFGGEPFLAFEGWHYIFKKWELAKEVAVYNNNEWNDGTRRGTRIYRSQP